MPTNEAIFRCRACGVERIGPGIGDSPGERTPCSNDGCGSVDLAMSVSVHDAIQVRERLRGKSKDATMGSRKGRKVEFTTGSEYFRRDGRWHRVERVINYMDDRYDETITDETLGVVVRECHERLSDHQGRGNTRPHGDR